MASGREGEIHKGKMEGDHKCDRETEGTRDIGRKRDRERNERERERERER